MDGAETIAEEEELIHDGGEIKTKAALYEEVRDNLVSKVREAGVPFRSLCRVFEGDDDGVLSKREFKERMMALGLKLSELPDSDFTVRACCVFQTLVF